MLVVQRLDVPALLVTLGLVHCGISYPRAVWTCAACTVSSAEPQRGPRWAVGPESSARSTPLLGVGYMDAEQPRAMKPSYMASVAEPEVAARGKHWRSHACPRRAVARAHYNMRTRGAIAALTVVEQPAFTSRLVPSRSSCVFTPLA